MTGHTWWKRACSTATWNGISSMNVRVTPCRVMTMNEHIWETRWFLEDDNEWTQISVVQDTVSSVVSLVPARYTLSLWRYRHCPARHDDVLQWPAFLDRQLDEGAAEQEGDFDQGFTIGRTGEYVM